MARFKTRFFWFLLLIFMGTLIWIWSQIVGFTIDHASMDAGNLAPSKTAETFSFDLDASSNYRILRNFVVSDVYSSSEPSTNYSVTLVLHCSLRNLYRLPDLAARWAAPISLAVFIPTGPLERISRLLAVFRKCHTSVQRYVSLHLVMLNEDSKTVDLFADRNFEPVCDSLVDLKDFTKQKNNYEGLPYPNNLLRNIGRKYSRTDYTFVLDIDFLPSSNLAANFQRLLSSHRTGLDVKEVFIVPAFEIQSSIEKIPAGKRELLHYLHKLAVRPFYFESCWKCQKFTDYEKWQNLPLENESVLGVAYKVLWQDPWEPFYLSSNKAPFFDERFKQYGFNRISQVCELHVAGYSFSVLNNAFVIHKGFKTSKDFHPNKAVEQEDNRKLFRLFKTELSARYNDSSRQCWYVI